MKLCKYFFFITVILFIISNFLTAEEKNTNKILSVLNLGLNGSEESIYIGGIFTIIKDNHTISGRILSKSENPFYAMDYNFLESNSEFSILYGKPIRFKRGADGFISFAVGLSYNRVVKRGEIIYNDEIDAFYKKDINSTLGIPLECQFVKHIVGPLGIGFYGFVNINNIESLYGGLLSLQFANFAKKREVPQVKSYYKNKKYIIEFNPFKFFHFACSDQLAINGCIGFPNTIKNCEITLPFHYRYSKFYLIHYELKQFFSIDLQIRKFLTLIKDGFYFNLGMRYFNIVGLYGVEPGDKTNSYWGISIGLGHRVFFTKNLYYSTQLNITKPLLGRMKYLDQAFAEEGINNKNFIFGVEIFNLGITF